MKDRRRGNRTSRDNRTTDIVQAIVRDAEEAAATLESDIAAGGDIQVVLGLLDAAEAILALRGVDLGKTLDNLRRRIREQSHQPPESER